MRNGTLILLGEVMQVKRGDMESIEGMSFTMEELDTLVKQDIRYNDLEYYTLSEFIDMCNNEKFNDDGFWISYIRVKEVI